MTIREDILLLRQKCGETIEHTQTREHRFWEKGRQTLPKNRIMTSPNLMKTVMVVTQRRNLVWNRKLTSLCTEDIRRLPSKLKYTTFWKDQLDGNVLFTTLRCKSQIY